MLESPLPLKRGRASTLMKTLAAVATVAIALLARTGVASAHTSFESSTPADKAMLDSPLSEITLVFSGAAEPAGDGFVILDAQGVQRSPDTAISVDNLTWVLGFDQPLVGGTIGVRWTVQAPDAHPIDGSFSFSVDTPPAVAPTSTTRPSAAQPSLPVAEQLTASTPASEDALGEFLATGVPEASGADSVNTLGRIVSLAGAMIAIGGLVFAAMVMRGDESDIRSVLFCVRRAAMLLTTGALVELVAQVAVTDGRWSAVWSPSAVGDVVASSFGIAVGLRFLGGVLLGAGARLHVDDASIDRDPIIAIRELATVGAGLSALNGSSGHHASATETGEPYLHSSDKAWRTETGTGAFGGALVVLASFLFDGHTVTEGDRLFHAAVNMAHVTAGAIWAGGVLMLAHVVWRRHRRGADTRALQLAIRFSVVAAIALVTAGIAGAVLAIIVLDSVSELWSTPWGRLLLMKMAIVGAAAAAGGYNHRVLIPELSTDPNDALTTERFRAVVTAEAIALTIVIATTALLVGAAS